MIAGKQNACAQNNALWCDAVLKAAGAKTQFQQGYWSAQNKILPLYPNIVTVSETLGAEFYPTLNALPKDAAVKDSFDCLDLVPLGFEKLFSGTWLFRAAQTTKRPAVSSQTYKVQHQEAFRKWVSAWSNNEKLKVVFSNKLLEKKEIEFTGILKDGQLRAGAVLNTGPRMGDKELVGLSNLFCRRSWRYAALHDLLEPVANKPVCTYEADDGLLPVYHQLGFEGCGRLSVWRKK